MRGEAPHVIGWNCDFRIRVNRGPPTVVLCYRLPRQHVSIRHATAMQVRVRDRASGPQRSRLA